jgi:NADPH:quinone reductase-like Zn-dependent oxidoreductase
MKAVLMAEHGGPDNLRLGDAPDPVAGPGEVVVDIHAASVNGADPKVRVGNGNYRLKKFPHILGRDFSGVVSQVGAGVTDFKVGDAVFGVTDQGIEGAYAEKIAIKAAIVAKKPDSDRRHCPPQGGPDDFDSRRRRRRCRFRRATGQASRCQGDHHCQRRQS